MAEVNGGAGTAVEEAPVTPEAEGLVEETVEEVPEGEGEETGESGRESDDGEEVTPTPAKPEKTVPLGALAEERRERAKLREELERVKAQLGETAGAVDKLKPPEKDALEAWYETLPDGNLDSDKKEEKEAAEFKQDAGLMLRVAKNDGFRKAFLAPILPLMQAMFRSLDLNSWQAEQAMKGLEAITSDEELSARLGDKIPAGVKHREKILAHHAETVKKNGGKWSSVREAEDAFTKIQKQADEESRSAAGSAAKAATERTLKEVTQRRSATGGPRSEATPARGGTGKPGKRTFEQIEAGGDFRIA